MNSNATKIRFNKQLFVSCHHYLQLAGLGTMICVMDSLDFYFLNDIHILWLIYIVNDEIIR